MTTQFTTDDQLRLMGAVDEMFDGLDLTDEDLENMLAEMHDKYSRRKPLAD
jgi:hypothetical protein